ncbi:MAG: 3-keto-disaccharide hydrolase [Bacteroidota bacterium]
MKKTKILYQVLAMIAFIGFYSCNQQTEGEWISIFNGKNLDGWSPKFTGERFGVNHLNTFQAKEGKLLVSYDAYDRFDDNFGHLFYEEKLSRFRLRLEYRFLGDTVPGTPSWGYKNSGIKYHTPHPAELPLDQTLLVAVEAQILGGDGQTERFTANVCTAGTHIVMNKKLITQHCTNSNYPAISDSSWVKMEIEVWGSEKVIHKINGEVVMEYSQPQYDETDEFARELMGKGHPQIISEGYIALQAEGHPIEFKNIELMKLDN